MIAETQPVVESPPGQKEAWRKGPISLEPPVEATTEQASSVISAIEEKKLSKHAKRRANKKKKIVFSSGCEDEYDEAEEEPLA